MKKLAFCLFILLNIDILAQDNKTSFTLEGKIEGLKQGDMLILNAIEIIGWNSLKKDTLLVTKNNYFSFEIPTTHTQYYQLSLIKPKFEEAFDVEILAQPSDTITLTGNINIFGAVLKKGGFYKNPLLFKRDSLQSVLIQKAVYNYQKSNKTEEDFYKMWDNIQTPELKKLDQNIAQKVHNEEFGVFYFLRKKYLWKYKEGKKRYKQFSEKIQNSFYGKTLAEYLKKREKLEVGNIPPNFTLVTTTEKEISLSDYKGKFLLLYWWGLCPASIEINPKLIQLYQKYHEKGLEIIGITPQNIANIQKSMSEDIKEHLHSFLNPIWEVVYENHKNNPQMLEPYDFRALPTLMLISPKGKTIFRTIGNNYDGLEKAFLKNLKKIN